MKIMKIQSSKPYEVVIGAGILTRCGELICQVTEADSAHIICDDNVAPLYLERVEQSAVNAGFKVSKYIFPAGEKQKNLATVDKMLESLAVNRITRRDVIIALGGGVTGDLAGFAAAVYLRGIDYIGIPTSLLAQVDSSVGGKTGCDLSMGKNLAGAFWPPRRVIIDPEVLQTLPLRYFRDGMGEVIKYGCIQSKDLFRKIQAGRERTDLLDIIYECVDIKRRVVEADEFESGSRMLLNFGHTMAHAIEKYYHYEKISHGEAVAVGMVMAAKAGERTGLTAAGCADAIQDACGAYSLPVSTDAPLQELAAIALNDKKSAGSVINLVLLEKLGKAMIYPVPADELCSFFGGKNNE